MNFKNEDPPPLDYPLGAFPRYMPPPQPPLAQVGFDRFNAIDLASFDYDAQDYDWRRVQNATTNDNLLTALVRGENELVKLEFPQFTEAQLQSVVESGSNLELGFKFTKWMQFIDQLHRVCNLQTTPFRTADYLFLPSNYRQSLFVINPWPTEDEDDGDDLRRFLELMPVLGFYVLLCWKRIVNYGRSNSICAGLSLWDLVFSNQCSVLFIAFIELEYNSIKLESGGKLNNRRVVLAREEERKRILDYFQSLRHVPTLNESEVQKYENGIERLKVAVEQKAMAQFLRMGSLVLEGLEDERLHPESRDLRRFRRNRRMIYRWICTAGNRETPGSGDNVEANRPVSHFDKALLQVYAETLQVMSTLLRVDATVFESTLLIKGSLIAQVFFAQRASFLWSAKTQLSGRLALTGVIVNRMAQMCSDLEVFLLQWWSSARV